MAPGDQGCLRPLAEDDSGRGEAERPAATGEVCARGRQGDGCGRKRWPSWSDG